MFSGKEDFLDGVTGEETVGQWISTYVTKGASGAAVITLSPGPRGQTWIFKSHLAKIHVWFCSLIMIFSYILSRAVVVRKKGANYSWLRRMVLRRLGYRLEIYQGCVTSCIPKAKCVKKNKKKVIFICACLDIVFTCRFLLFFKFWLWKWRGNALTAIVTSSKCKDEMQTNQFSQDFQEEIIPERHLQPVG